MLGERQMGPEIVKLNVEAPRNIRVDACPLRPTKTVYSALLDYTRFFTPISLGN